MPEILESLERRLLHTEFTETELSEFIYPYEETLQLLGFIKINEKTLIYPFHRVEMTFSHKKTLEVAKVVLDGREETFYIAGYSFKAVVYELRETLMNSSLKFYQVKNNGSVWFTTDVRRLLSVISTKVPNEEHLD